MPTTSTIEFGFCSSLMVCCCCLAGEQVCKTLLSCCLASCWRPNQATEKIGTKFEPESGILAFWGSLGKPQKANSIAQNRTKSRPSRAKHSIRSHYYHSMSADLLNISTISAMYAVAHRHTNAFAASKQTSRQAHKQTSKHNK